MTDVSAIIPVFNNPETLDRALSSALSTAVKAIILVDDGSDPPVPHPNDRRIRLVRLERNRGAAAARNAGVKAASTSHVAFLDSDDAWHPGKIAAQLAAIAADPAEACVTGFMLEREGRVHAQTPRIATISLGDALAGGRFGLGSTLLVSREAFLRSGGFDETLPRHEDWEWLLRFTRTARVLVVADALAQVHLGLRPPAAAVHVALDRIWRLHGAELNASSERRILRAAVALERAAAYRWSGDYRLLAKEMIRSTLDRPAWTARAIFRRLAHGRVPEM